MFPHKAPKWAIVVVAALLLLGIANAVYSSGWSQGFTTGLLIDGADGANLAPYFAYRAGPGWGHGIGFFGSIFRFLFFFLFLGLIFKALGYWRWRMHGGHAPWPGGPCQHEHGPHAAWGGESGQEPSQPSDNSAQTQADDGPKSAGQQGERPVSWDSPVINV